MQRRIKSQLLVAVTLSLAMLATAAPAMADPTPAERETARTLLVSGRTKRKAGKLKDALADFERAHAIMRVPTTGLDLGKTQIALGMLVEARANLLEAARYPAAAHEPPAFTRARSKASELAEEIAPRLPTLTVSVPAGAHVKIDNAEISASSIDTPLKVNPGKHDIAASLEGSDEKRVSVDLAERENKSVSIELTPGAKHPPPPPPPPPRPPEESRSTSSLVWIGLATAGIGAAVGTTTGILAFSVKGDVEAQCIDGTKCPPATHSDLDRGETFGNISTIAFIVAGVGAAVLVAGVLGVGRSTTSASTSGRTTSRPRPPRLLFLGPTGFGGQF